MRGAKARRRFHPESVGGDLKVTNQNRDVGYDYQVLSLQRIRISLSGLQPISLLFEQTHEPSPPHRAKI